MPSRECLRRMSAVTLKTRQRRVALLMVCALGAMLSGLAGRLVYIYAVSSAPLKRLAYQQHHMRVPIRPYRGSILDARLRPLAGSYETQSVFGDPKLVSDPSAAAAALAPILKLDADEVYRKLSSDRERRFVWLARRVAPEVGQAVRALGLSGVALVPEGKREYPNGMLAAHILGCVGSEQQGLEGLEKVFEERLAGREGEAMVLTDSRRRPIWTDARTYVPPQDGQHLVLTIDAVIQTAAEDAIREARAKFRAKSAVAIVMDPGTGSILAMANDPTFDPARYGEFPVDARRNRAVTDTFPPGSTAKPFIATAALEAKAVRFGQVFYCEDGYWAEARLRDASHRYGNMTVEQILIKSSNIGMAKIGVQLGNPGLFDGLNRFGFGRPTGVMLPGESAGRVIPLKKWTRLSTTRVPFGQEFAVTPLQLVTAFAAIANEGRLVKPKILRGVLDSRGRAIVDLSAPEVVGQVCSAKVAHDLIDRALLGVVEEGTGRNAQIPGYKVFGKTGTAQGIDPETRAISHTRYIGGFLGGAPADKPQVVVLVLVEEPDKSLGYYGGTVAAPAAKIILETTLNYLGVPPSEPVEEGNAAAHLVRQTVTD